MNEVWYRERMSICKECPFNSRNVSKKGIWYRFWDVLNFKEPFCVICGCEIAAKASVKEQKCSLKDDPKWVSIEGKNLTKKKK